MFNVFIKNRELCGVVRVLGSSGEITSNMFLYVLAPELLHREKKAMFLVLQKTLTL